MFFNRHVLKTLTIERRSFSSSYRRNRIRVIIYSILLNYDIIVGRPRLCARNTIYRRRKPLIRIMRSIYNHVANLCTRDWNHNDDGKWIKRLYHNMCVYCIWYYYRLWRVSHRLSRRTSTYCWWNTSDPWTFIMIIMIIDREDPDTSAEFVIFIDGWTFLTQFHTTKPEKRVAEHENIIWPILRLSFPIHVYMTNASRHCSAYTRVKDIFNNSIHSANF